MKFIPIGIVDDADIRMSYAKASDYSGKHYDGIQLRRTVKNGPVIIMKSKRDDPLRWKVMFGFSQVFFRTFAEAVEFCNSRGMKLAQEQYE